LPDYTGPLLGNPPNLAVLQHYWSPQALVRTALGSTDRIAPDTAHRYCNTDYTLLGLIVESATGERIEAQLWQKILQPLALDDTTFPNVDPHVRGPHAAGHLRALAADPYIEYTTMSPSQSWTAGAIISTPHDVSRFFDALFSGQLIEDGSLARMTDCTERLDARCTRGLGIVQYTYEGHADFFGHHGGIPGYTTLALRSAAGRGIVLYQNGFDMHDVLTSETPFIDAAATM